MSSIFDKILDLIRIDRVVVSHHGYDEMMYDNILFRVQLKGSLKGLLSKNIQSIIRAPAFLFYRSIGQANRFMLSGAFRKTSLLLLF